MIDINLAWQIAKILNLKFDKYSFEDFYTGLNIEMEHGLIDPNTNVTNNNLIQTAKIALAHLNEYSDYYNKDYGLPAFEEFLKNKNKSLEQ